jgi:hypothetical protein
MAGLKQEDEEVNCSMRLNKKRHVVVMWQIIDTFKKSVANQKISLFPLGPSRPMCLFLQIPHL